MEAHKIHYTAEGWLCNRYPYDLPIDDESRFIEVDEATYGKTLGCNNHFSWRVVDGKLLHERYEETPEHETIQNLRYMREEICFPVINRGQAWYDTLTPKQRSELATWYKSWLDAPYTKTEPKPPSWLFSNQKEAANGTNQD